MGKMLETLVGKKTQRVAYLAFTLIGPYLIWTNWETMKVGDIALKLALVPLALALFNVTFLDHRKRNQGVTMRGFFLLGITLALAGFGLYSLYYDITKLLLGIVGTILAITSLTLLCLTRWRMITSKQG